MAVVDGVEAPGGEALLALLRAEGAPRPLVDRGLAPRLRAALEAALAPVAPALPGGHDVRVGKYRLADVLACEGKLVAGLGADRAETPPMVRGILVDRLFTQLVVTGAIGDPVADATASLSASDGEATLRFLEGLAPEARSALEDEVREEAAALLRRWPHLRASYWPRTQERIVVPLVGGRVVLSGVVDLALGRPPRERASVCLVDVKSGRERPEHRADMHFYALLETLRSGAPPFQVATYYTGTGALVADPVDEDLLASALARTVDGAARLCRLAAGATPGLAPSGRCPWCPAFPRCGPGRRFAAQFLDHDGGPDEEPDGNDA